jgi:hypothetical protein
VCVCVRVRGGPRDGASRTSLACPPHVPRGPRRAKRAAAPDKAFSIHDAPTSGSVPHSAGSSGPRRSLARAVRGAPTHSKARHTQRAGAGGGGAFETRPRARARVCAGSGGAGAGGGGGRGDGLPAARRILAAAYRSSPPRRPTPPPSPPSSTASRPASPSCPVHPPPSTPPPPPRPRLCVAALQDACGGAAPAHIVAVSRMAAAARLQRGAALKQSWSWREEASG